MFENNSFEDSTIEEKYETPTILYVVFLFIIFICLMILVILLLKILRDKSLLGDINALLKIKNI